MEGETGLAAGGKEQIAAEGCLVTGDNDRPAEDPVARGEVPSLVELTVIRQKHLGDHAKQRAAVNDDAAIVEMPVRPERRPDDKSREEVPGRTDQPIDLPRHLVEYGVLKQEIVDRIGGEAKFREHHQGDPRLVAGDEQVEDIISVARRLGDPDMRYARADTSEVVVVRGKERGHLGS